MTSPALVANKSFDPSDDSTYTRSFPTKVYDSQGNEHTMEQFYRKTGTNEWTMYTLVDGRNPFNPGSTEPLTGTIAFNSDGSVNSMTADNTGHPPAPRSPSSTIPSAWSAGCRRPKMHRVTGVPMVRWVMPLA